MRTLRKLIAITALLGSCLTVARAELTRDVIVYSFVTEAGKKMTPPTADHPATYLLAPGGYREEGDKVAGEKTLPPEKISQFVRNALTAANYRGANSQALGVLNGSLTKNFPAGYDPAKDDSKTLDYVIVYYWGCMNPETADPGSDGSDEGDAASKIVFNRPMMLTLVAGSSLQKMDPGFPPWNEIMQAADQNRYFVIISAYSPAALLNHKQKKLLWRAQMSLDSDGTDQIASMPALVSASVPYLGRETSLPQQIQESLERPSQVIIGTPEMKEFLPAGHGQDSKSGTGQNNQ